MLLSNIIVYTTQQQVFVLLLICLVCLALEPFIVATLIGPGFLLVFLLVLVLFCISQGQVSQSAVLPTYYSPVFCRSKGEVKCPGGGGGGRVLHL